MMEYLIYAVVGVAFCTAIINGWRIVSFLEQNGAVKKNTPMRLISWFTFAKYFQIKKEQEGSYGAVGISYLLSIVILLIAGLIFLVDNLLKPL